MRLDFVNFAVSRRFTYNEMDTRGRGVDFWESGGGNYGDVSYLELLFKIGCDLCSRNCLD